MDDDLREAERAFRESRSPETRAAYARQLRRVAKLDDLVRLIAPGLGPELVGALAPLLGRLSGRTLLVGSGQFSPRKGHDRVAVLDVTEAPVSEWDGFVPTEQIASVRAALADENLVLPGELDFMYATPWQLAWTVAPAPFRLWETDGETCSVAGGTIRLREGALSREQVRSVAVWLADGWVTRGVSILKADGESVVVAVQRDVFPQIDPTYDGFNLMFDASWAPSLGNRLAQALGVECLVAEELR